MNTPVRVPAKPDLSGLTTAAALFWFEALGLMGLGLIVVMPLIGFMHATWPPSAWTDGSAVRIALLLLIVGAVGIAGWIQTSRHLRLRTAIFTGMGVMGLAVTLGAAATVNGVVLAAIAFWLGWPSLMLVVVWGRRLLPAGRVGPQASDRSGRELSDHADSPPRVVAGFAIAVAAAGILVGLVLSGLGLIALMFAVGQPSSATPRLTAVGLAAIVLGIASVVAAVRVRRWILTPRDVGRS